MMIHFQRKKDIGLYIHIPFCPSKCHYCSFAVITDHSFYDQYLAELKKELKKTIKFAHEQDRTIRTVYFGGGTPSTLKKEDIIDLLSIIIPPQSVSDSPSKSDVIEISFELNPEHVTKQYLSDLKEIGITRVSIGIQSLDEKVLQKAGRKHTRAQALHALSLLQNTNIPFNVDLILGLPDSTKENFIHTLEEILQFQPSHISSYFLTIESGTPFQLLPEKEFLQEEVQLEIFEQMKSILLKNGFTQYEISNWAKETTESKHNLMYWRGYEYLGVGLGAGSFFDHKRWSNIQNMNLYMKNQEKINLQSIETLSKKDTADTYLMTALRLNEGIDISYMNTLLSDEELIELRKNADDMDDMLETTANGYKIKEGKRLLHNFIVSKLL
ncbi:MAG: radical SAM family heme chaperone HemW [Candidatus Gracilibacteria bacterium]